MYSLNVFDKYVSLPRRLLSANLWLTAASNPTPKVQKKLRPFTSPWSHTSVRPSAIISSAALTSTGMFRWRASPLPEPQGMIPKATPVPHRALAVSLTVPSPPAASTISKPLSTASRANVVASSAEAVRLVVTAIPSRPSRSATRSSSPSLREVPETGFIMSRACFLSPAKITLSHHTLQILPHSPLQSPHVQLLPHPAYHILINCRNLNPLLPKSETPKYCANQRFLLSLHILRCFKARPLSLYEFTLLQGLSPLDSF